jgi:lipopolysaccharide/colanic/teichoic acid biosynthesis glycosyltransferase
MAIVKVFSALLASLLSRLAVDELNSWNPVIVKRLKDIAVQKLPPSQRERFAEEWSSDLLEIPGSISRLIYSLGLLRAARSINLQFAQTELSLMSRTVKRTFDITIASTSIVLMMPAVLLICLAVKLSSPGPIFVKEPRIGRRGHTFLLRRFRTTLLEKYPHSANDVSITPGENATYIGSWLQKLSLDLLPNFFNVLNGDMSLVGPRPRHFLEAMQDEGENSRRYEVLPGIIGPWDVSLRTVQDGSRREIENEYAKRMSLGSDIAILLKAFRESFRKPF